MCDVSGCTVTLCDAARDGEKADGIRLRFMASGTIDYDYCDGGSYSDGCDDDDDDYYDCDGDGEEAVNDDCGNDGDHAADVTRYD